MAILLSLSMVLSLFGNVGVVKADETQLPEEAVTSAEPVVTQDPLVSEEPLVTEQPDELEEEVTEAPEDGAPEKEDGVYIITDVSQLDFLRENLSESYKLGCDLDLNEVENLQPIGTAENPFTGSFTGNGYEIKNLKISGEENTALFGCIQNASINDIILDGATVSGTNNVGAIVGYAGGVSKKISNCTVKNAVINGTNSVGGIIGSTDEKSIVSSRVICDCSFAGTVTGEGERTGGIAGYMKGGINCSNVDASIKGVDYCGGIAGQIKGGTIEQCYVKGGITGGNYVGGIVGRQNGAILEKSYSVQSVSGKTYVGGIIGESNGGTIENCFAIGNVSGDSFIGGMIGQCTTSTYIINSYVSACTLSKDSNVGGLCSIEDNLIITDSYFDISVSELDIQATSSAGRETDELRSASTFKNWDTSSTWSLVDGKAYPYLVELPIPEGINGPDSIAEQQGTGTLEDPYIIVTKKQLRAMGNEVNAYYRLGTNINMAGEEWNPVGTTQVPFTGGFDGAGYTISNFAITRSAVNNVGFFGVIKDAAVKDITFDSIKVAGKSYVGIVAGLVQGNAWNLNNIHVTNTDITAVSYAGGLAGSIAAASSESIDRCSFDGTVTATSGRVAGLAGNSFGDIKNSYVTGTITGTSYVGGLTGYSNGTAIVSTSYCAADLTGTNYVGGLIGYKGKGTINNSFAIGTITGTGNVGGLLGAGGTTTIQNCYGATIIVSSATTKNGIVGSLSNMTTENTYYDGEVSNLISNNVINVSKTTTAMHKKATFKDWDFDTLWDIEEGKTYPFLRDLPKPEFKQDDVTKPEIQGDGTEESPFLIYTADDLLNIAFELDSYSILMNDIDLEGAEWTPVGSVNVPFSGNFNGNGYTIKNFTITQSASKNVGFFGTINNAVIEKLTIEDAYVSGDTNVGALVGCVSGTDYVIRDCNVIKGSVTGDISVGGLIGATSSASTTAIIGCSANTTVTGTGKYTGGLVGSLYGSLVSCYTQGTVSGVTNVGGIVGYSNSCPKIEKCYSGATVSGTTAVGGLIGMNIAVSEIINCFTLGSVTGTNFVGGIAGNSSSMLQVNYSYVAGAVQATGTSVAGLCGNISKITCNNSFYDGTVVGLVQTSDVQVSLMTRTMRLQATYVGWDFDNIWMMEEGITYPYLREMPKPEDVSKEVSGQISEGNGSEENPYILRTEEQLRAVQYEPNAFYVLAADIDLGGAEWNPIGTEGVPFSGGFNGSYKSHNYVISNFSISQGLKVNIGFFGTVSNAKLQNITFEKGMINGKNYVGTLVGKVKGKANVIENCKAINCRVTGTGYVGGLLGYVVDTGEKPILNCSVDAEVVGTSKYAGLLVGYLNGDVKYCTTKGTVEATSYIGGIAGYQNLGTIEESYSEITATDGSYVGGIAGSVAKGKVKNCYALGSITGTNNIGGILGGVASASSMNSCYSSVKIISTGTSVGGLTPYIASLTITSSFYNGEVSGVEPKTACDYSYLTTTMLKKKLYAGWDFEKVWSMEEGTSYPKLQAFSDADTTPADDSWTTIEGSGTAEDPYIITSKEQLNLIRYELTASYKLDADIDMNGQSWSPVGKTVNATFRGALNGNGHIISSFVVSESSSNNIGFFGIINGATIENLTIYDAKVTGKTNVGILVGNVMETTWKIRDCHVTESRAAGTTIVGGVAGIVSTVSETPMTNVSASVDVIATGDKAGGLVGSLTGDITKSYALGTVQGENYTGGLVGHAIKSSIDQSYFSGSVTGGMYVGGLVGYAGALNIENCYGLGNVTGSSISGGIIGQAGGTGKVENCYSAAVITGTGANVNGICGTTGKMTVTSCYYNRTINPSIPLNENYARYTSGLKRRANFVNWNFKDIWGINEYRCYPFLTALDIPDGIEGPVAEDLPEGSGTKEDPYIIRNRQQLESVKYDLTAYYEIVKDIDLEGMEWEPLGSLDNPFTGHIDGHGFTIKNLQISVEDRNYVGLFGAIQNAEIKNINISGIEITATSYIGGLVGYMAGENSYIENCHVTTGTIRGISYIGGLVGYVKETTKCVVNCSTNVEIVVTENYAGGLIGYLNGEVSMCFAEGTVDGACYIGGLIGYGITVKITNSFSLGSVTGVDYVGGIIGYCEVNGSISYCYAATEILSVGDYIGGIYGIIDNLTVTATYHDGMVSTIVPKAETDMSRLPGGMKNSLPYVSWDFESVWTIENGVTYPYLRTNVKPQGVKGIALPEAPSGIGTKENPYIIMSVEQLISIKFEMNAYFKLGCDLDLTGIDWIPLGTLALPFSGHFDGAGHTITGLTINTPDADYVGLFGVIKNATIIGLNFANVSITGHSYVGVLAGAAFGENTYIKACTVKEGTLAGAVYTGGIIGKVEDGGLVEKCMTQITITCSGNYCGGIIGYLIGTLKLSHSESIIQAYDYAGGLVGYGYIAVIIECYFAGHLTGHYYVGGILGGCYGCIIRQSYVLGEITATGYVGGIIGISVYETEIINCYAACKIVSIEIYVGGIISVEEYIKITGCYYDGIIAGIVHTQKEGFCKLSGSMKYVSTYVGWDFNSVWTIEEGKTYPYLRSLPKPEMIFGIEIIGNPSGAGTKDNPYIIRTPEELINIKFEIDAYFKLECDISLEGIIWIPVGTPGNPFRGNVDGNGHTISGLVLNLPDQDDVGFFGSLNNAVIQNLNFENATVIGRNRVGVIAGSGYGDNLLIKNCNVVMGTVNGVSFVGGIAGRIGNNETNSANVYVSGCQSSADVVASEHYAGNVLGYIAGGIEDCSGEGNVTGVNYIGGITGYHNHGTLSNCFSIGDVDGNSYVGGIVGYSNYATEEFVESIATVTGNYYVGGIAGYSNNGIVSDAQSLATVKGKSYVGGITGYNNGSTVEICVSLASTEGNVLPLIKENNEAVITQLSDSFATVSGTNYVGGIIGYSYAGRSVQCTSDGSVTGKVYVGGVVGYGVKAGIEDCENNSSVVGTRYTDDIIGYNKK